jgi:hypothetical protein
VRSVKDNQKANKTQKIYKNKIVEAEIKLIN